MKFGETLKKLRVSKGLTQDMLSEKSGLTLRTVQRIERDEVNLNRECPFGQ
jgi:cytoskeletal protein RodZ